MSKKPYQIRTTYLDGTVTRDMIDNYYDDPKQTLDMYIMSSPNTHVDTKRIEVMNLDNEVLHTFTFVTDERRAA